MYSCKLAITTLLILVLFSASLIGQSNPDTTFKSIFPRGENGIAYEKVFEVDSLDKKTIVFRIKEWAVATFNSQKAAWQSEDIETGYLIYQGIIIKTYRIPKGWGFGLFDPTILSINYETKFSIHFYIKDNRFKLSINNIIEHAVSAYGNWSTSTIRMETRPIDVPSVPIEEAGLNAIADYKKHAKEKKYLIRLNYTANLWRDIHKDMLAMVESIKEGVVNKKKSPFDF